MSAIIRFLKETTVEESLYNGLGRANLQQQTNSQNNLTAPGRIGARDKTKSGVFINPSADNLMALGQEMGMERASL